jgi:WD40 repeat protein
LIELQNRFILKTYEEHSNQINAFAFKSTMREFIVGANDTNIKLFDILEQQSVLSIHNAHSDNIKRVRYLDDFHILSASADRTVRLWDLRSTKDGPLDSIKLSMGAEDFCFLPERQLVVANGPILTCLKIGEDQRFIKQAEYQAFQRSVMRVRWDPTKERLLASGLDSQMKVFSLENDGATPILKVAYKVKLPEEVSCMDVSLDGNHYALGLASGALIIKSKSLATEEDTETDE